MTKSNELARRWIVRGRVQGVSYRYFTQDAARRRGLAGFTRNLADGTVEVKVRGPAAEIDALRTELRRGPTLARVDAIDEEELDPAGTFPDRFEIRY